MKESVIKYLKKHIKTNLRHLPDDELFRLYVFYKEGIDLDHMAKTFYKYAKEIIDKKDIKERLKELRDGEISSMDYETDTDLADYLEHGFFIKN